jgi:hypothetical protein
MKLTPRKSPTAADKPISYVGYRFPPEVISNAVWLYFRFPLSLRMVEEMLTARSIKVTYETVRRWALKFGARIARRIRAMGLARGDKWHLDEVREHEDLWGLSLRGYFGPTTRIPPSLFSAGCRLPPHNSSCSRRRHAAIQTGADHLAQSVRAIGDNHRRQPVNGGQETRVFGGEVPFLI